MEDKFDCIIVGGGVAGLSAAMTLARNNMKFLLIERGEFSGAKNVSGGVLWGQGLSKLVPNYWEDEEAGFERFINNRRLTFMDGDSTFSLDFKSHSFNEKPYKGVIVLRAKFDNWLASKVEEAIEESEYPEDSFIAPNILVEEVLMQDGQAVGIRAGEEEFYADSVIISEGVNNLLTRQVGLQDDYVPADGLAVGVKEIIKFEQKTLEDRFQLNGLSGMSNEFIGTATQGVEGGGFLYTNRDSLSFGLVLGMNSLRDSGHKPYDILNEFKAHPVIADTLKGGEVVEYSAHAVSTGDMNVMPKELYGNGVLIAGEAANLLMNSGKAIQGMDYALHSGVLAAETITEAKKAGDFSKEQLKSYRSKLEDSFVLKDMRNFQDAVAFLHSKQMFQNMPGLVCDFGKQFFSIENKPTPKTREMLNNSVRKHSSYWDLIKLGIKGAKSL